jgi:AFG3 family protein
VSSLEVVNRSKVKVHLHNPIQPSSSPNANGGTPLPSPSHGPAPYQFTIGSLESFESLLISTQDELGIPPAERIPMSYRDEVSTFQTFLHFAPTLLIAGLLVWSMRRSASGMGGGGPGGGIFGVGKSKAKMFNKDEAVSVRFKDVAGMDEAKEVSPCMEFAFMLIFHRKSWNS